MLKCILIDIDNTLLSFDEYVKETMKKGFEEFGIGTYNDEMFFVFNQINNNLWESIERGEMDFGELQKVRWNMIFESLGVSADGAAFEKYFRGCLFNSAIPEDGAVDLLKYLYGKYILCVASNGPYLQQVNRLKISGMLPFFSHVFVSEEIGYSKPSEDFFYECTNRISIKSGEVIKASEIMIIGDSLTSDMSGGIRLGMQTCFYNPHGKSIPSALNINYNVKSLNEIKSII